MSEDDLDIERDRPAVRSIIEGVRLMGAGGDPRTYGKVLAAVATCAMMNGRPDLGTKVFLAAGDVYVSDLKGAAT